MNPGEQLGVYYEGTFSDIGKKIKEKQEKAENNMINFLENIKKNFHGSYFLLVEQLKLYVENGKEMENWAIENLKDVAEENNPDYVFSFDVSLAKKLLEAVGEEVNIKKNKD